MTAAQARAADNSVDSVGWIVAQDARGHRFGTRRSSIIQAPVKEGWDFLRDSPELDHNQARFETLRTYAKAHNTDQQIRKKLGLPSRYDRSPDLDPSFRPAQHGPDAFHPGRAVLA